MSAGSDHRAYHQFQARVSSLLADYTLAELESLREQAAAHYPAMGAFIEAFIGLARRGSAEASPRPTRSAGKSEQPLYELLCSPELFPTTKDLQRFAKRVLPGIRGLERKGRPVVAKRIMDHLEKINGGRREELERAMRHAIGVLKTGESKPQSFFSQWEKIIKGLGK